MNTAVKTGLAAILLLAISCTKESLHNASDVSTQSLGNSVTTYYIGQRYGGGVIFYIDSTGKHGLIADSIDLEKSGWWNGSDIRTGAIDTAIGTGRSNTRKIVSAQDITGNYAALQCANSTRNGYRDWFLPSKYELYELYKQQNVVGYFHKYYFSSSEKNVDYVWYQCFFTGEHFGASKSKERHVRAIRAF